MEVHVQATQAEGRKSSRASAQPEPATSRAVSDTEPQTEMHALMHGHLMDGQGPRVGVQVHPFPLTFA